MKKSSEHEERKFVHHFRRVNLQHEKHGLSAIAHFADCWSSQLKVVGLNPSGMVMLFVAKEMSETSCLHGSFCRLSE